MKHKVMLVMVVLTVTTIAWFSAGCGGGARKVNTSGTSPFPTYNGPTGSIVLHVIWPQGREIPPETTVIDIEVTGEGLQVPRKAQIQRPQQSARIDNLPIGPKGVSATARAQAGGAALAYGFATTVVEPGQVKDVVIELKRIEQAGVPQARALIQEIRDSVISLSSGLAQQVVDQSLVWTVDLVPTFALMLQRLDFVRIILIEEHEVLPNGYITKEVATLTSLPPGVYQAYLLGDMRWWWVIGLKKIGDPPAPNTWVVKFPEDDALVSGMELTLKVTEKTNNLNVNEGEFRVVSTAEPQLLYEGKFTVEADSQNRVTKLTVIGTFKDKFLLDGITVQGTVVGTPQEGAQKSYTQVSFTGSIQSPKFSLSVGEATVTFAPPQPDHEKWGNFLTKAELKNLNFKTVKVAEPVEVKGNLSIETQIDDQTAEEGPLPNKGNFIGSYVSSKLAYEGSMSFNWQNPQRELSEVPKGTITLSGRLAVPNKPVFSISLTLTSSSPFEIAIDITRGDHFLRGKLTGDWEVTDGQLEVTNWQIELKNENDLVVKIHEDTNKQVVGTIFASDGTTKLADIGKDPDLGIVIVRYIDGTLESLLPIDLTYSPKPVLGTVRGQVIDAETEQGISGAWVWSGYETTVTDNEGFYELKAIAGHQTIISVSHWDYQWKAVKVDVPAHGTVTVNIKLERWQQPQ